MRFGPNDSGIGLNTCSDRFTVLVEGNIGVGKSTLLKLLKEYPQVEIIPEPVDKWKNVGEGHNLLDLMYKDPERWSGTFQTYAMLTILENHKAETAGPVKVMERSVQCFRNCFIENLFRNKLMSAVEYEVLDQWYNWAISQHREVVHADLIVYLRSSPKTCLERIKSRSRSEECGVELAYLEGIHQLHEEWLMEKKRGELVADLLVLDADKELVEFEKDVKQNLSTILGGVV